MTKLIDSINGQRPTGKYCYRTLASDNYPDCPFIRFKKSLSIKYPTCSLFPKEELANERVENFFSRGVIKCKPCLAIPEKAESIEKS